MKLEKTYKQILNLERALEERVKVLQESNLEENKITLDSAICVLKKRISKLQRYLDYRIENCL